MFDKQNVENKNKGLFITLESLEGGGKGSVAAACRDFFLENGLKFHHTREPGGTLIAEEIRHLLLTKRDETEQMHPMTEMLLMFASRNQHYHKIIKPMLDSNVNILSERWVDSSIAYQVFGRGLDEKHCNQLIEMTVNNVVPDLTIILDVDVEVGLARARGRAELDRIELEGNDFFERAKAGFYTLQQRDPNRYVVIDAGKPLEDVKRQVIKVLTAFTNSKLELHQPSESEMSM